MANVKSPVKNTLISVNTFNNWQERIKYKYEGRDFAAKDWNGIYYISGQKSSNYQLSPRNRGDLIEITDLYEENVSDNLASAMQKVLNSSYFKNTDYVSPTTVAIIQNGINACEAISRGDKIEVNSYINEIIEAVTAIDNIVIFNLIQG